MSAVDLTLPAMAVDRALSLLERHQLDQALARTPWREHRAEFLINTTGAQERCEQWLFTHGPSVHAGMLRVCGHLIDATVLEDLVDLTLRALFAGCDGHTPLEPAPEQVLATATRAALYIVGAADAAGIPAATMLLSA